MRKAAGNSKACVRLSLAISPIGMALMNDLRTPKGFEDRWSFLTEPRRYANGRIILTNQLRTHLSQFARQAPQAIMKKASGSKSLVSLQKHLNYISRDGELPLEGRDGERLQGRAAVREAAADWTLDEHRPGLIAEISKNYVVSYADAADREAVHAAGRAFARQTFASNHEYLLVPHTDTAYPHLHISVRALGDDGRRLDVDPKGFEQWRHAWVERLQEQGLEAAATPRWSRGLVQRKNISMAMRVMTELHEEHDADPPRVFMDGWRSAFREVRGQAYQDQPWVPAIVKRHKALVETYRDAAQELRWTGRPEDVQLSEAVEALVARFPEPITQRTQRFRQAMAIDQRERMFDWAQKRDRNRDDDRDKELSR